MTDRNKTLRLKNGLQRLITEFGGHEVRNALDIMTAPKVGRPKLADWKTLTPVLEDDANRLLGRASGDKKSNKSIATQISSQTENHSAESAQRRIMRKLSKDREHYSMVLAVADAICSEPWRTYLELTQKLSRGQRNAGFWNGQLEQALAAIDWYTAKFGLPSDHIPFAEIIAIMSSHDSTSYGLRSALREENNDGSFV